MISTMDKAGRIVIPKTIRSRAGLRAGAPLEIRLRAGRIEIEPAPRAVELKSRGGFLVAEATDAAPPLTAEEVRRTLDDLRTRPAES